MARNKKKHKRNCNSKTKLRCASGWNALRDACLASVNSFGELAKRTDTGFGPYFFKDNGADILAVAHLDTVQSHRHFGAIKGSPGIIYNCQLDDRLGAWLILDLFPSMGIGMDVLLTTGEERAQSTARFFQPAKAYNWIAEFDRSGTDVVTYENESQPWLDCIGERSEIGWGSYSDISEMSSLGVCSANWGIGYYRNHCPNSHFVASELFDTVNRFEAFYKEHAETKFPIERIPPNRFEYIEDDAPGYWDCWDSDDDGYSLMKDDGILEIEWREYFQKYGNTSRA